MAQNGKSSSGHSLLQGRRLSLAGGLPPPSTYSRLLGQRTLLTCQSEVIGRTIRGHQRTLLTCRSEGPSEVIRRTIRGHQRTLLTCRSAPVRVTFMISRGWRKK